MSMATKLSQYRRVSETIVPTREPWIFTCISRRTPREGSPSPTAPSSPCQTPFDLAEQIPLSQTTITQPVFGAESHTQSSHERPVCRWCCPDTPRGRWECRPYPPHTDPRGRNPSHLPHTITGPLHTLSKHPNPTNRGVRSPCRLPFPLTLPYRLEG